MIKKNLKQFVAQSREFLKYTLVVIVILVISLLFPKQPQPIANLEVGDTWNHPDLVASRSFVVEKEESRIEDEKNQVIAEFPTIYTRNPRIADQRLMILKSNLNQLFVNFGQNTVGNQIIVSQIAILVDSAYIRGIYLPDQGERNEIKVLQGDTFDLVSTNRLFTESEAENFIHSSIDINDLSMSTTMHGYINESIVPNIVANDSMTRRMLNDSLARISNVVYEFEKGETLIRRDEIVDQETINTLRAYQRDLQKGLFPAGLNPSTFMGYLLLTCLIIGALLLYLRFHFNEIFDKLNTLTFVLIWPVLFSFLVYIIEGTENISSYIIPFCIVPIVVKNFFSERLALFLHIVIILIASFLSKLGYEFTFLLMLTGIVTVLVVSETRYWSKFFNTIVIIFSTYILGYLGLALIKTDHISDLEWINFGYLTFASLLTMLAYPFIPLLERLFGFTSSISLAELSDMSNPQLKEMSIRAPGTLQHSMQVANLAEAAADKIGANSLLVKVGALYHDIGKLVNPEYFIENQAHFNPHDSLSYFESAKQIIRHVSEGEKMARKAKLPQVIIDFIVTHHGTTKVEYFYRKQVTDYPDREFDELLFRYPGPKPRTKEEAILMMADSLEASAKSLRNPTATDIEDLVENIVNQKIKNKQLEDSSLSFSELEKCKNVFKSLLRSIHHVRIEYPKAPEAEEQE